MDELLNAEQPLEVRIDRSADASRVLSELPWVSGVTVDGDQLLLVNAPAERAAELTRELAEGGLYLAGLRPREQSLERYFLDVTGERDASPAKGVDR